MSLDAFFSPTSIAVIGVSSRPSSVGYAVFGNLAHAGERSFPGPVYAVNPKGGELFGHRIHQSLKSIGSDVDLVVIATPPRTIAEVLEEAGEVGCRAAVIISAGFSEMGESGRERQEAMVDVARRHGIRVIGPNCLGVIRPRARLNASFAASAPPAGSIGLLSQSGALITGIISYACREQFGLSAAVSLGAKADVSDPEMLRWLAADEETRAIALYVEGFPDPRAAYEVLADIGKDVPVVALKGGTSEAGARATKSHTGSLAGSAAAYRAAFAQAGVLQVDSIGDFIAWSRALAYQPRAPGRRLAIVTNAGGPGVLCADEAGRRGLELATLSARTQAALDEVLPRVWSRGNPVDIIGDATPERYRDALNVIGAAPEVDGIVVIMTVQSMTDPKATAEAIAHAHADPSWKKPMVSSFLGLAGSEVGSMLDRHGVPELDTPERAVSAMAAVMNRSAYLDRSEEKGEVELSRHPEPDLDAAAEAVAEARAAGQSNLDLDSARRVLACAGIRYNRSASAANAEEAVEIAEDIGYPVVLKVISPDVVHKSDVGGVSLGVASADQVRSACESMTERVQEAQPDARITGFVVEESISGTEIIVGVSRDPGFGPLLMVGMGGIFVEVYKDVSFRLIPLERVDALAAIEEIRAQALLDGARSRPILDRRELAEVLLRVSRLVEAVPEIEELDINPLVITDDGLVAIDARVIVR